MNYLKRAAVAVAVVTTVLCGNTVAHAGVTLPSIGNPVGGPPPGSLCTQVIVGGVDHVVCVPLY